MLSIGTLIRTSDAPFSRILQNRTGTIVRRYTPPLSMPDLDEYLVRFDATAEFPAEEYYLASKFILPIKLRGRLFRPTTAHHCNCDRCDSNRAHTSSLKGSLLK